MEIVEKQTAGYNTVQSGTQPRKTPSKGTINTRLDKCRHKYAGRPESVVGRRAGLRVS